MTLLLFRRVICSEHVHIASVSLCLTLAFWLLSPVGSTPAKTPPTATPMEVTPCEQPKEGPLQASQDPVPISSEVSAPELESASCSSPKASADEKMDDSSSKQAPVCSSVPTPTSSQLQQGEPSQCDSTSADPCEHKQLQEGQEIYIQTEGLTVQMAEPGLDRIVIVNGPDGTTMHIQTPEGVPLEAVQALLGIETSDEAKASQ